MPKVTTPLTDLKIKQAKPSDKDYTLTDGKGLYLLIKPSGSKLWRFQYVYPKGKRNLAGFGPYPGVSLDQARQKREEWRVKLQQGINPQEEKKAQEEERHISSELERISIENRLSNIIAEWEAFTKDQTSPDYFDKRSKMLQRGIIPFLGERPIHEIEPLELLEAIKKTEERGKLETAHRLFTLCGQIWKYAVTHGKAPRNITADIDKRYALKKPDAQNFAHIIDEKQLGILLRDIDNFWGDPAVKYLLKLLPYLFVRPSELRLAEWSEFDFEKKEWTVPTDRMGRKTGKTHIVPLADQVITLLKELHSLTGQYQHLFPGRPTTRAVSDGAHRMALNRMGYQGVMSGHGFRHTASTLLNEHKKEHGFDGDVIEECLAHMDKNRIRGTYNHAKYADERRQLMAWWADYLDGLKNATMDDDRRIKESK